MGGPMPIPEYISVRELYAASAWGRNSSCHKPKPKPKSAKCRVRP